MSTNTAAAAEALSRRLYKAIAVGDWSEFRALLHDDATWVIPGDNAVSGIVDGADAVTERGKKIISYGHNLNLLHILVSRENMALLWHNTSRRDDAVLDEYLATVCRLHEGKIANIETYMADVPGMNAFFV